MWKELKGLWNADNLLAEAWEMAYEMIEMDREMFLDGSNALWLENPEDIEKAIQYHCRRPEVYEAGGKIALLQGDYETAVHYCSAALDKGAKSLVLFYTRGRSLFFLGKLDESLADVEQGQKIAPEDPDLYDLQGLILNAMGQHAQADNAFEYALGIAPDEPLHYYHRALAYMRRGRYELAIEDLGKVIRLDPGNRIAYLKRAICYQDETNSDLAQARVDNKKVENLERGR